MEVIRRMEARSHYAIEMQNGSCRQCALVVCLFWNGVEMERKKNTEKKIKNVLQGDDSLSSFPLLPCLISIHILLPFLHSSPFPITTSLSPRFISSLSQSHSGNDCRHPAIQATAGISAEEGHSSMHPSAHEARPLPFRVRMPLVFHATISNSRSLIRSVDPTLTSSSTSYLPPSTFFIRPQHFFTYTETDKEVSLILNEDNVAGFPAGALNVCDVIWRAVQIEPGECGLGKVSEPGSRSSSVS